MVYEIIRSRRRTVALEVTREGRVLVRAPMAMPEAEIARFVASHAAWLEKAQDRVAARQAAHPPLTEQERDALRQRAGEVLPGKVAHYAAIMGVVPAAVKITAARTRFGSCSGKNSLCFSLYLMRYPEAAIDYVVVHELAHIRRRDCLRKLLLIVCLCLYWWNPLVWIMVRLADRDMELACDEAVLRALGPACKKPYALALLDMAQRQTKPSPLCSSFAKSCAEERVRAILRFRRLPVWTGALTAVLFLLAAGVLATQAQTAARVPEAPAAMQEQAETPEAPVNQPVIHIDPVITPAPAAQEPEAEAPAYVWPLEDADAAVTDAYGWTVHPLTQKESFHSGVDLEAEAGQNVLAVAAGTVLDCSYSEAYGYHVTLEHENGVQTMYAHLRAFYVESGDTVAQGQVIAAVGATGWAIGPHLHLSVFRDGEAVDPLDALASALE